MAREVHDQTEEEQLQARSKTRMQDNLFQRLQKDSPEELQDEVQEQLQEGAELRDQVQHPLREAKTDVRKANLWSTERGVHPGPVREVSLLKEVHQSALWTVQHQVSEPVQEGSPAEVCHPQRSEVHPSVGGGAQDKDQEVVHVGSQKAPGQVLLPTVTRPKLRCFLNDIPSGRTMMFYWTRLLITRQTSSTSTG